MQALLAKHNLVYSEGGLFTAKGREWLAGLPLHPIVRSVVERMLTLVEMLDLLIKQASAEVTARAEDDQAGRLLCTIPGIGYYSALLIAAEIDGIERFPDARRLCSYAGLVPSVRASGSYSRLGHITKQDSPWLRWILVEACQKAASRADFVGEHYRHVARRKGNGVAKVAAASKLLKAAYSMLKQNQTFADVCQSMTAQG